MNKYIKKQSKKVRKSIAECVVPDDLPDGAYWAMMEEFNLEPTDFVNEEK